MTSAEMYAPLRCSCGGEAKLACSNGCDEPELEQREPVHAVRRVSAPHARSGPSPLKGRKIERPRSYAAKACAGCGQEFQPTGPRSVRCERCR